MKPELTKTEIRIVFGPSAKCDRVSLNNAIHQGPKMQRALKSVLLRFRRNPVALMCDIPEMYLRIEVQLRDEMYLRIEVAPGDRPHLPFLWRVLNQDERPTEYEFNRVDFGLNFSSFQAQFVVKTHAEKLRDEFPMGAETVLKSTYKDDSMDSVANDDQGVRLYKELNELWSKAGMKVHKWLTNSPKVLKRIPTESRASVVHYASTRASMVKTLGVA